MRLPLFFSSGLMRSEKFADQGHVLFEGYTANQVAGIFKVHNFDIGLLGKFLANHWLCAWCRNRDASLRSA
jgi:hypothetical protein